MKEVRVDGIKWTINKYGVAFRTGKEDFIDGYYELIFPDFETERRIREVA